MPKAKSKVVVLDRDYFPSSFKEIVKFYIFVEKLFVFVARNQLLSTLKRLQSLYLSFDVEKSRTDGEDIEFLNKFRVLSALCPLGIQLTEVINNSDGNSTTVAYDQQISLGGIELSFPLHSGCNSTQTFKRHKMLDDAINEYLKNKYSALVDKKCLKAHPFSAVKESGWPVGFDSDAISLPDLPRLQREFSSISTVPESPKINESAREESFERVSDNKIGEGCPIVSAPIASLNSSKVAVSLSALGGAGQVLDGLKAHEGYRGQIAHCETIKGRPALFADLKSAVPNYINKNLLRLVGERIGVTRFYTHQAAAINHILDGKHVVVSTATSSGKSVIYNLPVMSSVLRDAQSTALYLFPTKALAQDQLRVLKAIICAEGEREAAGGRDKIKNNSKSRETLPVWAMACDGDTGFSDRIDARDHANIILTNPDMMHCTFLPNHKEWARLLKNLKFVIIDESHQYRGAFGCHVACVLRRLVRLCGHYGSTPQFVCCSATIANPAAHFSKLLPLNCVGGEGRLAVVDSSADGSPQGERMFVIWNPPLKFGVQEEEGEGKGEGEGTNEEKEEGETSSTPSVSLPDAATLLPNALEDLGSEKLMPIPSSCISHATVPPKDLTDGSEGERESDRDIDSLSLFLEGCEDRPSTLSAYQVGYHRGWNRSGKRAGKGSKWVRDRDWEGGAEGGRVPSVIRRPLALASVDRSSKEKTSNPAKAKVRYSSSGALYQRPRVSSIGEMAQLLSCMVKLRVRTLAFCGVRKLVELVLEYSLKNLKGSSSTEHLADCVGSYRGGYTKEERRTIEAELFSGRLLGVTATCALELGVDIGDLDVTLHLGFPRSFSSLWQQAGRAGRSGRSSLSILVCHDSPVDQFFCRNPAVLLGSPSEPATMNPDNIHVLRGHLLCAAKEIPLNSETWDANANRGEVYTDSTSSSSLFSDRDLWGIRYCEASHSLLETQDLVSWPPTNVAALNTSVDRVAPVPFCPPDSPLVISTTSGKAGSSSSSVSDDGVSPLPVWRMHPMHRLSSNPSKNVSLRLIDPITINVVDTSSEGAGGYADGGKVIDSIGYSRAFYELFEGAIYMHRARQYLVHKLDLPSARALCKPVKVGYYTACRNRTDVNVLKVFESSLLFKTGTVRVVASVYGYAKIRLSTGEEFEEGECSLPSLEYETTAAWIDLPLHAKRHMDAAGHDVTASIHAVNHILSSICPLFAECDENDVATEHEISSSATATPYRLLLYDKHAGGLGVCDELYLKRVQLLATARDLLSSCPCGCASAGRVKVETNVQVKVRVECSESDTAGCPSCLLTQRCSSYNKRLAKRGAIKLLDLLIELQAKEEEESALKACRDAELRVIMDDDGADPSYEWGSPPRHRERYICPQCSPCRGEGAQNVTEHGTGVASSSRRTGGKNSASSSVSIDDTPRKMRRMQAMKNARFNQTERNKSVMTVQKSWTEQSHQFISDRDLLGPLGMTAPSPASSQEDA